LCSQLSRMTWISLPAGSSRSIAPKSAGTPGAGGASAGGSGHTDHRRQMPTVLGINDHTHGLSHAASMARPKQNVNPPSASVY
jgi:hypothetical protein